MADHDRDEVAGMVLGAWDAFLHQAEAVGLDRPTRLPGWRVHEVCVHLGSWPDHDALADLIRSARTGGHGEPPDPDALNARLTAAHRDAPHQEVLAALRRHRDAVERYFAEDAAALGRAPTVSVVGRLPLTTVVLGEAYELAVHGLDLAAAGAPPVPSPVLQAGLAALSDITGALAAAQGLTADLTLAASDGGWRFRAEPGRWTVHRVPAGQVQGTVVTGAADLLLEAASGRVNPVAALARRRLAVHGLGGLLRLLPIVEATPNIPGGPVLRLAGRSLGGAAAVTGRLFGRAP